MRRSTRVLLGVNAVLLAGLLLTVLPRAVATMQGGGGGGGGIASRPRGQYVMLAGRVLGSNTSGIYIADAVNRELIALRYGSSDQRLEPFGFRDLNADSAAAGRAR
ncbi:MAG: hypothetical protein MUE97_03605 [Phycisphaerales bacterium]|nr:hypothetical protein [Phycisphaerales bacterium]